MKTISMKTLAKCCVALCAAAAFQVIGSSAFADPTGTNYTFTAINTPGGPPPAGASGSVLWNNSVSFVTVPGTGLDIDEQVTLLPGNNELLEWAIQTTNGAGIVPQQSNSTLPSGIFFTDIVEPAGTLMVDSSGFIYFTRDGVPQPMSNPTGNPGIVFFPHPLNPAIQVLALGNDANPIAGGFGIDTNALQQGLPLSSVLGLVGLGAQINFIDDAHIGVAVHVPEPSTMVLCGLGLLGLIPVIRRRLKK